MLCRLNRCRRTGAGVLSFGCSSHEQRFAYGHGRHQGHHAQRARYERGWDVPGSGVASSGARGSLSVQDENRPCPRQCGRRITANKSASEIALPIKRWDLVDCTYEGSAVFIDPRVSVAFSSPGVKSPQTYRLPIPVRHTSPRSMQNGTHGSSVSSGISSCASIHTERFVFDIKLKATKTNAGDLCLAMFRFPGSRTAMDDFANSQTDLASLRGLFSTWKTEDWKDSVEPIKKHKISSSTPNSHGKRATSQRRWSKQFHSRAA